MALTFNTGMTSISAAESITNWGAWRVNGSGAAPAPALDNVTFKEGSNSISARMAGANANGGLIFDYYTANGAVLNMTTAGNEVLAIWALCTSPAATLAANSGGMWIVVQSSSETGNTAPTVYSRWYVSGADVYPGGWVLFMVDTRKTPSLTGGGGANLASVRRIGFGITLVAVPPTLRSDNLYVDAMWYGRPNYRVVGDGSTTCNWASFLAHSQSANNGLISDIGGAYGLNCGIQFGNTGQAATTTFSDATGRQAIFQRKVYYFAGGVSGTYDALNYSDYYIVQANGAAGQKTSVTFGSVVGTSDGRQGVLGGAFRLQDNVNQTFKVDFQTNIAGISAAKFYGVTFAGAHAGLLFDNNAISELISCQFVNCGEIDPGATNNGALLLSCQLIDPSGGTAANRGLQFRSVNNIKYLSCITSGAPTTQHMLRLVTGGTYSVTMTGIVFYGDFSSGTLWHAEASGSGSGGDTITLNCTSGSGSNPSATEVDKTVFGGTIAVSNPVTVTFSGMVQHSEIRVYSHGTTTELSGTEDIGAVSTYQYQYTFAPDTYVDVVVMGPTPASPGDTAYLYYRYDNYLLPSSDAPFVISQQRDRQYYNPA